MRSADRSTRAPASRFGERTLREYYDGIAHHFQAVRLPSLDSFEQHVRELLALAPGGAVRALDLGCGSGRYAEALRGNGVSVVEVDKSLAMLRAGGRLSTRIRTQARAELLPFLDRSFDLCYAIYVDHQLADRRSSYAEIARVLRHGRPFVLITSSLRQLVEFHLYQVAPQLLAWERRRFVPFGTIQRRAERAGLCLRERHVVDRPAARLSGSELHAIVRNRALSVLSALSDHEVADLAARVADAAGIEVPSVGYTLYCFERKN